MPKKDAKNEAIRHVIGAKPGEQRTTTIGRVELTVIGPDETVQLGQRLLTTLADRKRTRLALVPDTPSLIR